MSISYSLVIKLILYFIIYYHILEFPCDNEDTKRLIVYVTYIFLFKLLLKNLKENKFLYYSSIYVKILQRKLQVLINPTYL